MTLFTTIFDKLPSLPSQNFSTAVHYLESIKQLTEKKPKKAWVHSSDLWARVDLPKLGVFTAVDSVVHGATTVIRFSAFMIRMGNFADVRSHAALTLKLAIAAVVAPILGIAKPTWAIAIHEALSLRIKGDANWTPRVRTLVGVACVAALVYGIQFHVLAAPIALPVNPLGRWPTVSSSAIKGLPIVAGLWLISCFGRKEASKETPQSAASPFAKFLAGVPEGQFFTLRVISGPDQLDRVFFAKITSENRGLIVSQLPIVNDCGGGYSFGSTTAVPGGVGKLTEEQLSVGVWLEVPKSGSTAPSVAAAPRKPSITSKHPPRPEPSTPPERTTTSSAKTLILGISEIQRVLRSSTEGDFVTCDFSCDPLGESTTRICTRVGADLNHTQERLETVIKDVFKNRRIPRPTVQTHQEARSDLENPDEVWVYVMPKQSVATNQFHQGGGKATRYWWTDQSMNVMEVERRSVTVYSNGSFSAVGDSFSGSVEAKPSFSMGSFFRWFRV